MIKVAIFDLGGVVVSPEIEKLDYSIAEYIGTDIKTLREITSSYKSELTKGNVDFSHVYSKVLEELAITHINSKDVLNKHLETFREILSSFDQNVLSIIERLKKNYTVVCLANSELDVVPIAKELKLYEPFERAYISTKMGMEKPEAEIYLAVLEDLKKRPEETIFIDDKRENVEGAIKVGINGIHYTKGETDLEKELFRLVEF